MPTVRLLNSSGGADSLKAYKRSIATKKVVGRPKNL